MVLHWLGIAVGLHYALDISSFVNVKAQMGQSAKVLLLSCGKRVIFPSALPIQTSLASPWENHLSCPRCTFAHGTMGARESRPNPYPPPWSPSLYLNLICRCQNGQIQRKHCGTGCIRGCNSASRPNLGKESADIGACHGTFNVNLQVKTRMWFASWSASDWADEPIICWGGTCGGQSDFRSVLLHPRKLSDHTQ